MSRLSYLSRSKYPSIGSYESDDEDSDDESQDTEYEVSGPVSKKAINKGRWTKDEDEKLKRVVENHGSDDWRLISTFFTDRNDIQCQHRWSKVLNPDLIKGPWTKEEDEKVLQLVGQFGPKRWTLISKHLKGRTGKQCRERWHNHLNPEIKKSAWTEDEDRMIYQLHKKLGNRWAEIAKYLPGRTDNAIKNHWNSTMRRKFETEEEQRIKQQQLMTQSMTTNIPGPPPPYPVNQSYTPSQSGFHNLQPIRLFDTNEANYVQRTGPGSLVVHNRPVNNLSNHPGFQNAPTPSPPIPSQSPIWGINSIQNNQQMTGVGQNQLQMSSVPSPAESYGSAATDSYSSAMIESYSSNSRSSHGFPSPMKWTPEADVQTGKSCIPDYLENLITTSNGLGDLSAYEFLCGAGSDNVDNIGLSPSPFKYTNIKKITDTYRFDGNTLSSLKAETGGLIPMTSPIVSKLSTPPILRRNKRSKKNADNAANGLMYDYSPFSPPNPPTVPSTPGQEIKKEKESDETKLPEGLITPKNQRIVNIRPRTPKDSPIHGLPFSPSQLLTKFSVSPQFLNSPGLPDGKTTSTPVSGMPARNASTPLANIDQNTNVDIKLEEGTEGNTGNKTPFRTPRIRRSILDATPRTPTPFKNALAEMEKRNLALRSLPDTPSQLVEDLNAVIEEETGVAPFSSYKNRSKRKDGSAMKRKMDKENTSPRKKARKSLERKWSTPGDIGLFGGQGDTLGLMPETPSKSLIGDQSIVFSPPSILKETLPEETIIDLNEAFAFPTTPKDKSFNKSKAIQQIRFEETPSKQPFNFGLGWEKVACGKTKDQLELTEQARQYLSVITNIRPRSLKL